MATIRSWGLLTFPIVDIPGIGRIHIGHHTWVTAEGPDSVGKPHCWPVLGGGNKAYCDGMFNNGVYTPPRGETDLAARLCSGEGDPWQVEKMGGTASDVWGIPTYARIAYLLHGVCHQMANRLLLPSGQSVVAANNYLTSALQYGMYGTRVPIAVAAAMAALIPFSLVPLGIYIRGINADFANQCRDAGVKYPGPLLAASSEDRAHATLIESVLRLHGYSEDAPAAQRVEAPATLPELEESEALAHQRHLREMDLQLDFASRGRIDERKLAQVRDAYDEHLAPRRDVLAAITEAPVLPAEEVPDATPAQLERLVNEVNRDALSHHDKIANILGAADFQLLFGSHPDGKIGLADPRWVGGESVSG